MEKELKITPPEGYEIDTEKSTLEHIVFKKSDKERAKTYEEIVKEAAPRVYVTSMGDIVDEDDSVVITINQINTEAQAKKLIALAQLFVIMDYYNDGWVPNWEDINATKYIMFYINSDKEVSITERYTHTFSPIAFKSVFVAKRALKNNKEIFEAFYKD